jgi:hypothetical protein
MLDQGNPCGALGWQNWSKSGSACDYPSATLAFSHTFSTRGWRMPWGEIGNPLEGERPGFDSGQNVWGRSSARFPLGRGRTPEFGHLA